MSRFVDLILDAKRFKRDRSAEKNLLTPSGTNSKKIRFASSPFLAITRGCHLLRALWRCVQSVRRLPISQIPDWELVLKQKFLFKHMSSFLNFLFVYSPLGE